MKTNLSKQFTADNRALLQQFDLSRNTSLRTLETTAESINAASDTASNFLKTVLSTVPPTVPLDVVIVYREVDLGGIRGCWLQCTSDPVCFRHRSSEGREADVQRHKQQFKVFREVHDARDFRLVLCADVYDCMVDFAIQTLEHNVYSTEVNGGLEYLLYAPLIISERRKPRTRAADHNAGWSGKWPTIACAL